MRKNKFKMTGLLLIFALFNQVNAQVMTELVYMEVDQVDTKSKTVVLAGRPYQYKLDIENSSYRFEEDAKTSVSLSQLKMGEKYFFQLMAKGSDVKNKNYTNIIFISKSKPSE
ncbi:hypothetical protein [Marinicella litoralis]|uniref:Uncharacterized protein n=1 Tax=Marinicella litoralis TaxID=644220 RepID=A0A4R6XKC2_9GAMM|nr:hypothetical protein [Marinicella litoralis]TDR18420.1 hypothetical protein C8D91_2340 [Marinicella litoralis]